MKRNIITYVAIMGLVCLISLVGISVWPRTNVITPSPMITSLNPQFKNTVAEKSLSQFAKIEPSKVRVSVNQSYEYSPIPTNRPWSSGVFSADINGNFTYPLAYRTEFEGLLVGKPDISVQPNSITSALNSYLSIRGNKGVQGVYLNSHTDISSTFTAITDLNEPLFDFKAIQGSPYTYIKPLSNKLELSTKGFKFEESNDGVIVAKSESDAFLIKTNGSVRITNQKIEINFTSLLDSYVNIGYTPGTLAASDSVLANLSNTVDSVTTSFSVKEQEVTTTHEFTFNKNATKKSTLLGLLPNHGYSIESGMCIFVIDTIRGNQCFVEIADFITLQTPRQGMIKDLPFEILTEEQKNEVKAQFIIEANSGDQPVGSSYFGAKDVARLGRLIEIGYQLDDIPNTLKLQKKLKANLEDWFTYSPDEYGKHFTYDSYTGGLIAQNPEFGVDLYNDHHFQYGYFVYAAAVLGEHDEEFYNQYSPFVNALVRDIASSDRNDPLFPYMRVFDFYEGHSWAAGFARFDDGNNQESSSEAINAWYSVWRWSLINDNEQMRTTSEYLYSQEVHSTRLYWLNRGDINGEYNIFKKGYEHDIAGIVWSGKIDYATFFNPSPLAIHGIQYLPFTPGSIYLYEPEFIKRDSQKINDYLGGAPGDLYDKSVMYVSMLPEYSEQYGPRLTQVPIDGGNSRSNMIFWSYFWRNIKSIEWELGDKSDTLKIQKGKNTSTKSAAASSVS